MGQREEEGIKFMGDLEDRKVNVNRQALGILEGILGRGRRCNVNLKAM
jgi:hypothetical protein